MADIRSFAGRAARMALLGGVLALAAGCTTLYRNHGYAPTDDQLAEVLVGVDTRGTVADVIGPPTASGVINGGDYYYVQSRFRYFGPLEPREIDRERTLPMALPLLVGHLLDAARGPG